MQTRWIGVMLVSSVMAAGAQTRRAMQATGPFDVEVKPDTSVAASYGRMTLSKHYHGALEATADGEMLTGGDPKAGTAGYVAIERVEGTLDGRAGAFQLMHWGTMDGGKFELKVGVVPGSGTGALAGITGTMTIEIAAGGKHSYALVYELPTK